MAAAGGLTETWRGLAEAGFRYYGVIGRLAIDGLEAVLPSATSSGRRVRAERPHSRPAAEQQPALVLEATPERQAFGVFVVENALPRAASGNIVVSPFTDPSGRTAAARVTFSPDVVSLDPREQVLVQLAAAPGTDMEPGIRYRAEVSVPGLSGMKVPIVLIRRSADSEPVEK